MHKGNEIVKELSPEEAEHLRYGTLVKHSGAVQISNRDIGLVQRKCYNVLLAAAYPHLKRQEIHQMRVWDLCKALEYRKIDDLKESLEKLAGTVIKWNVLKTKDKSSWAVSTLLAGARIDEDNVVYWSYEPYLRDKLANPAVYARISMAIQGRFRSKYALILYEIAVDAFIAINGITTTRWITLSEFRVMMGCETDKTYDQFMRLNNKIIKPSVREVNEMSDIHVEVEFQRQRHAFIALRYTITPKPGIVEEIRAIMANTEAPILDIDTDNSVTFPDTPRDPDHESPLYVCLMKEYGQSKLQATKIIQEYEEKYILEKMGIVDEAKNSGSIKKSVGAMLQSALKDDFQPAKEPAIIKEKPLAIPDGTVVEIEGQKYRVEDGFVITGKRSSLPVSQIRKGIGDGTIKIVSIVS